MFRTRQTLFAGASNSPLTSPLTSPMPELSRCHLATTTEASTLRRRRRRKHVALLGLGAGSAVGVPA